MPITRAAALSFLFAATLVPACDPDKGDADGAEDSSSGAEDGSSGAEDSSSGAEDGASDGSSTGTPQEPADQSREGESCQSNVSAACRVDGVEGLEFCGYSWETSTGSWSACLTEPCTEPGESRACEGGTQYCTSHLTDKGDVPMWGVCTNEGECKLGESKSCGFGEEPTITMGCGLDESGVPRWDWEACNTPLVLSFGAELEFAPARASAAEFDIHGGAGVCTRADWPSPATPWLALDRDRNGSIDGGHELFGSGTRMAAGTGPHNGFDALAELDSDGDGKLSPADARWSELVLWADHDGDRRSSTWEALPLASFEVVEIELAYANRRECDGAGNCGLERARFVYRTGGKVRTGEVIDVHLACE
jgi:hypothetical protein